MVIITKSLLLLPAQGKLVWPCLAKGGGYRCYETDASKIAGF